MTFIEEWGSWLLLGFGVAIGVVLRELLFALIDLFFWFVGIDGEPTADEEMGATTQQDQKP